MQGFGVRVPTVKGSGDGVAVVIRAVNTGFTVQGLAGMGLGFG